MVFRSQNFTKNAKIKKVHENSPRESWEALDRGILHRISARIQPRRRHFAKPLILQSQFFRFSDLFLYIFVPVWGLRWGHKTGKNKNKTVPNLLLLLKGWSRQDREALLMFLHVVPWILIAGVVCFTFFWWFRGCLRGSLYWSPYGEAFIIWKGGLGRW